MLRRVIITVPILIGLALFTAYLVNQYNREKFPARYVERHTPLLDYIAERNTSRARLRPHQPEHGMITIEVEIADTELFEEVRGRLEEQGVPRGAIWRLRHGGEMHTFSVEGGRERVTSPVVRPAS